MTNLAFESAVSYFGTLYTRCGDRPSGRRQDQVLQKVLATIAVKLNGIDASDALIACTARDPLNLTNGVFEKWKTHRDAFYLAFRLAALKGSHEPRSRPDYLDACREALRRWSLQPYDELAACLAADLLSIPPRGQSQEPTQKHSAGVRFPVVIDSNGRDTAQLLELRVEARPMSEALKGICYFSPNSILLPKDDDFLDAVDAASKYWQTRLADKWPHGWDFRWDIDLPAGAGKDARLPDALKDGSVGAAAGLVLGRVLADVLE